MKIFSDENLLKTNFMSQHFPLYCQRNLYYSIPFALKIFLVLASARQLAEGDNLNILKRKLSHIYGCQDAFLTCSGRVAITIFLRALKRQNGNISKKVALPFYVCQSVPDAVINAGFEPVFMPIHNDLTMSLGKPLYEKLKTVSVVIIPHIYGYPARMRQLLEKVREVNEKIFVIDDAASGYGFSTGGQRLGSFGDAGILSFAQGKPLNATEGGALLLYNKGLLDVVTYEYKLLAKSEFKETINNLVSALWRFGCHRFSDPVSYWLSKYDYFLSKKKERRYYRRLSNLDATILVAEMDYVNTIHEYRATIISRYCERLSTYPGFFFPQSPDSKMLPVSRFYFGLHGVSLKLKKNGEIEEHNPLYLFAREHGVKLFYPYLPTARFISEYKNFWEENQWIYCLLGLPIDYKRPISWHDRICDVILSYVE
jgi:dTDP-4-amino-4,6-dideoxygalactose transaminase